MKFEMPARIRLSETDQDGNLTLFHLVNYFQDAGTFHAEDVERGLAWSREQGAAWVIAAWQLHIFELPRLGDRVMIRTWPYSFRGFLGGRNYTMETEDGRVLVNADSEWVLMDLAKNRPARVEPGLLEIFGSAGEEKLEDDFGARKVRLEHPGEEREAFSVQEYHLDTNHHVNNAQYVRMAEQYLEEGFQLSRFRADYKKQAYLGDRIVPKVCRVENGVQVSLDTPEGESYFTAEFLEQ